MNASNNPAQGDSAKSITWIYRIITDEDAETFAFPTSREMESKFIVRLSDLMPEYRDMIESASEPLDDSATFTFTNMRQPTEGAPDLLTWFRGHAGYAVTQDYTDGSQRTLVVRTITHDERANRTMLFGLISAQVIGADDECTDYTEEVRALKPELFEPDAWVMTVQLKGSE